MREPDPEVVVIGGGPGGATAAALLAGAGHDVALFEMQKFPRFQVGESLIPAVNRTLDRLGLLDRLDGIGSVRKHGVQFFSPNGPSRPFYFSETAAPDLHQTWQVVRSDFDAFLLDHARSCGVRATMRAQVVGVEQEDGAVTGVIVREGGADRRIGARVVVDASGQRSLLARQLGDREHIPGLENAAVFAHYRGVRRDAGRDAGSTLVFRLDSSSWFWLIPLPEVVSIGLVAPARHISSQPGTPSEILDAAIATCPALGERLVEAQRSGDVRVVKDFSYRAKVDGGRGWALVGDALSFIDPVYSTGLFLTMLSAELAADAIHAGLERESRPDLRGYSASYQVAFGRFLALVRAFYQDGFRFGEIAREPEQRQGLVDLLIGNVESEPAIAMARTLERLTSPAIPS